MSIIKYNKEKVFTDNQKVVVVSNTYYYNHNKMNDLDTCFARLQSSFDDIFLFHHSSTKGKATCDEEDKFDFITGKKIASAKCQMKAISSTITKLDAIERKAEELIEIIKKKKAELKTENETCWREIENANH